MGYNLANITLSTFRRGHGELWLGMRAIASVLYGPQGLQINSENYSGAS